MSALDVLELAGCAGLVLGVTGLVLAVAALWKAPR